MGLDDSYSLDGVGTPGIHLENYIYHINFAKEMGIPYITIDAGSINMWETISLMILA